MQDSLLTDKRILTFARAALVVLTVYLAVLVIAQLKSVEYIGTGIAAANTITVSGHGEIFAVPDTAEFTASVQETAKDVQSAQSAATAKVNAIDDYLKAQGIDEKDIQTTDYNVSPQYEYQNAACPAIANSNGTPVYCPPGKQVLTGYQVSETLTVKVRDTSKAGGLLSGVGEKGASQVSGLNFTIADQDAVNAQARDKAITDAKTKADALAKQLGVQLVRVTSFNENQGGVVYPMYAKAAGMTMDSAAAPAPAIETGQNKITDDVTISYEIR